MGLEEGLRPHCCINSSVKVKSASGFRVEHMRMMCQASSQECFTLLPVDPGKRQQE